MPIEISEIFVFPIKNKTIFEKLLILIICFIIRIEFILFVIRITLSCILPHDARYSEIVCRLTFLFDLAFQ